MQYEIVNVEWITGLGCVLTLFNSFEFPLFSEAVVFDRYMAEKCKGFVAVLREDADKCNEKGLIRTTIRLDTTYDFPSKHDFILLTPVL